MEWNQIIPEFDVFNLEESLHFYIDLVGFHVVYDRKENKFAFLQFENVQLMLQEIKKENYKWETGKLKYPLGIGINFQIDVIILKKKIIKYLKILRNIGIEKKKNYLAVKSF